MPSHGQTMHRVAASTIDFPLSRRRRRRTRHRYRCSSQFGDKYQALTKVIDPWSMLDPIPRQLVLRER
jgi:hypothetical protein